MNNLKKLTSDQNVPNTEEFKKFGKIANNILQLAVYIKMKKRFSWYKTSKLTKRTLKSGNI